MEGQIMEKCEFPDHRLVSTQLPEEKDLTSEIYAAANFESEYQITRRDFLKESTIVAGIAALAPMLLQGCATTKAKVKVPTKVRVKNGTHLLDAPGGSTVRIVENDELLDFIEEQGNFVKVRGINDNKPLWVAKMEAIYEEFTEQTQSCGTPIPTGYTCTCNCVPISIHSTSRRYCTCNQVCTCNLIPAYR
jgi:hypothetical protein